MQTKFSSATPTDINTAYSVDDVVKLLDGAEGDANVASPIVRLRLTKMLYDVLDMKLTSDIALSTIAEPPATLTLAPAGGGKTTWAQIKAILEKLMRQSVLHPGKKIRGEAILCLVYNKHNVQDMIDKHKAMVNKLRAYNIKGLDIDDEIHACTLHSFCDFWRREYVARLDLLGANLLENAQAESFMRRSIRIACKKLDREKEVNKIDPSGVLELYMYYRETMCEDISDLETCDKFIDLGIDSEMIETIFERYESSKKLQHKYDFVDMLYRFYCLLRDDESVRTRVQKYYEYVIADEVQDFTPLMWEILKLLVSNGTPLTCIGDEDQNIYAFRGANIYNTLNFATMFPGGKIYSLEFNRRCGSRILDEARKVIQMNTLRFDKVLRHTHEGGEVIYEPYNTLNGQFVNILREIKTMNYAEQENTVICYRDGSSSTILADMLMSEGITFNVISGVGAFEHELYRHLFGIFDALEMPYDMGTCLNLYKVLPCNKEEYYTAIGYDAAKGRFIRQNPKGIHFKDYDYGKLGERQSFADTIVELGKLSDLLVTRPVNELIQPIFNLMNKYFWGFKKSQCNKHPEIDEIMQARVLKFFDSSLLYSEFFRQYQTKRSVCRGNTASHDGITLSTFHSLKGLEFDNVIVVCMDDSIFPNYGLIDSRSYPSDVATRLKEAEVRLWYVAITRAKKSLHVFYSKDNPSIYVRYALANEFPVAGVFKAHEAESSIHKMESSVDEEITSDLTEAASNLDDLDDLDDLDLSVEITRGSEFNAPLPMTFDTPSLSESMLGNATNTVSKNTFGISEITPGSVAEESQYSGELHWKNTADLVKESAITNKVSVADESIAVESEGTSDTSSNEENKDQPAENTVQLKSGKSLYVSKLINSL